MTNSLGIKLKNARLDIGLSQSSMANDIVTRTMLSKIENGAAKPSLTTLTKLAERVNKPLAYFLSETVDCFDQGLGQQSYQHLCHLYQKKDYKGVKDYFKFTIAKSNISELDHYKCFLVLCNSQLVLGDYENLEDNLENIIAFFIKQNDQYFLSKAYHSMSLFFFYRNLFDDSKSYSHLAIDAFELSYNSDELFRIKLHYVLGYTEYKMLDYANAIISLQKSLDYSKESESSYKMGDSFMILSNIYKKNKDMVNAIIYVKKASKYFDILDNKRMVASCQANLGAGLLDSNEYIEAAEAFQKSISLYEELKSYDLANNVRTQLFTALTYTSNVDYMDELLELIEESSLDANYQVPYYIHKAKYYLHKNMTKEAKDLLLYYEINHENRKQYVQVCTFLAEAYSLEFDYKTAFEYSQKALDKTS